MKKFGSKSSHRNIERFGITILVLSVALIITFVMGFRDYKQSQEIIVGDQSVYTPEWEFSLSGITGTVPQVYRSEDGKTAYMLMYTENIGDLSVNAEQYTTGLASANITDGLDFKPSASFFVFGNTGYMGYSLHDENGIPNQVLSLLWQNASKISPIDITDMTPEELAVESDITVLGFNPGANGAKVMSGLNDPRINPNDLYLNLVGFEQEKDIMSRIQAKESEMATLLARIEEYSSRLESAGYVAPERPDWMADDSVTEDGHIATTSRVPRGHVFDYVNASLDDGYINQVTSMDNLNAYLQQRSQETPTDQSNQIESLQRVNGSTLDLTVATEGTLSSDDQAAIENVRELDTAYNNYFAAKTELQVELLGELLNLDRQVNTQDRTFSVTSDPEFVKIQGRDVE